MLIPQRVLAQIADGSVTCAFRRWARPTVKTGGALRTAIGVLRIDAVTPVDLTAISTDDARRAGYASRDALCATLGERAGTLYRIDLHLEGPDPRVALRSQSTLSDGELEVVRAKLARLDAASEAGPWTRRVLERLRDHPRERAVALAERLGVSKEWLKPSVRKLKNLGLTVSHEVGYELSPRGARVLAVLR